MGGVPFFPPGGLPPVGFPPGFVPPIPLNVAGDAPRGRSSAEQAAELAALLRDGADQQAAFKPDVFRPKASPKAPPAVHRVDGPGSAGVEAAEGVVKKRRRNVVEGLASGKAIKSGGVVTVYSGYSSATATPQIPQGQTQRAEPSAPSRQPAPEALPRQLPEGWEMKRSRTTNRIYYVNEKLGVSQFDPPAGSTLKTEVKKKQKSSKRMKDIPDAQLTDKNGVMGLIRAGEKRLGRWNKWQQCSQILNAPEPDEE